MKQELIERALALTWKTMEDMEEQYTIYANATTEVGIVKYKFSIEKFCYYLLSPKFQYEYHKAQNYNLNTILTARNIWDAIYEYQSWNEQPLISLLETIW